MHLRNILDFQLAEFLMPLEIYNISITSAEFISYKRFLDVFHFDSKKIIIVTGSIPFDEWSELHRYMNCEFPLVSAIPNELGSIINKMNFFDNRHKDRHWGYCMSIRKKQIGIELFCFKDNKPYSNVFVCRDCIYDYKTIHVSRYMYCTVWFPINNPTDVIIDCKKIDCENSDQRPVFLPFELYKYLGISIDESICHTIKSIKKYPHAWWFMLFYFKKKGLVKGKNCKLLYEPITNENGIIEYEAVVNRYYIEYDDKLINLEIMYIFDILKKKAPFFIYDEYTNMFQPSIKMALKMGEKSLHRFLLKNIPEHTFKK